MPLTGCITQDKTKQNLIQQPKQQQQQKKKTLGILFPQLDSLEV